ncbi:MAG: hypothetical protein WBD22_03390 [Pyrinomonadaceae bacterium]
MKPATYEKLVPTATFAELWSGRLPDFRARNEMRNTERQGISAGFRRHDDHFVRLWAEATTEKHVAYLEKRGYTRK